MMPRNNRRVKTARPLNKALDQTATTSKPPVTVDDLLRRTPLPAKYRHLTEHVNDISAAAFVRTILGCIAAGLDDDGIAGALYTMATHHKLTEARCTTCLAWRKTDNAIHAAVVDANGEFGVITVCKVCQDRITAGKATPLMEKNLRIYGFGMGVGTR